MKSYEEMARYVLEVRDEHEKKRRKRKIIIRRYAPVTASLCALLLICLGTWKNMPSPDISHNYIVTTTTESAAVTAVTTAVTSSDAKKTAPAVTKTSSASENAVTYTTALTATVTVHKTSVRTGVLTTQNQSTRTNTKTSAERTTAVTATDKSTQTTEYIVTAPSSTNVNTDVQPVTVTKTAKVSESIATMPMTTEYSAQPAEETTTIFQPGGMTSIPWALKNIEDQYPTAELDDYAGSYTLQFRISATDIDSYLCEAYMYGYDPQEGEFHKCMANAYTLKNTSPEEQIAIKFDDVNKYFLYRRSADYSSS
jgi:hypothetical protein